MSQKLHCINFICFLIVLDEKVLSVPCYFTLSGSKVSFLLLKNIFTRNKILVLQYTVSPTPPYTHSLLFLLHILKMLFHSPRVCVISEEKSAVIPLFILLDIMCLFVSLIDFNSFFFCLLFPVM